jgi:uncharacterized protein
MNYREQAIDFNCEGEQLAGIISGPVTTCPASGIGLLIVVGGPQYRVGSHRQFVLLARALAAQGHHCLRFDYRGMGDSSGPARSFENVSADIGAAIEALRSHHPELRKIVLWGLCDGASASLLYVADTGERAGIDGLCLLNPWVRTETSLAKTHLKHYYTDRLRQKEFWLKLLSGKVALGALAGLLRSVRTASTAASRRSPEDRKEPFNLRMAQAWKRCSAPIQLILSGDDYTAKEFLEQVKAEAAWSGALTQANVTRELLPGADHTFSSDQDRLAVEARLMQWLKTQMRHA